MKLTIGQIILERAEFKHQDDYLRVEPTTPLEPSSVGMAVQVQRAVADPNGSALVRVSATSAEDAPYQFSVTYVLFYAMEPEEGGAVPEDLDRRLMVTGATMLFPFIREAVANLTSRGRFGPSWLAPTNFNNVVLNATPPEALASSQP